MTDKEISGIWEAYKQVHTHQEEVEQLDEAREASHDPEGYEERQRRSQSSRQRRMNDPHTGINSPAFNAFMTQQMSGKKKKKVEEETDLFDTILEHLVAEGYADTNEAALAIMANMSEGWRESIVEELEQLDEISLKTKMSAYARSQDPDADYQYGSKVHAQGDRIKKAIVKKHGEKAGEHAERHADAEHWGRKDASGKRKGLPKPRIQKNRDYRTTKAGKMHGQDQSKLKRDLKYNRFVED